MNKVHKHLFGGDAPPMRNNYRGCVRESADCIDNYISGSHVLTSSWFALLIARTSSTGNEVGDCQHMKRQLAATVLADFVNSSMQRLIPAGFAVGRQVQQEPS